MANFRRTKPRSRTFPKRYDKWKAKKLEKTGYYWWMGSWPAWWDIIYHRRPHRARTKALKRKLMAGVDPDNVVWPVPKKPHNYYW